jgi:hypothetical protein
MELFKQIRCGLVLLAATGLAACGGGSDIGGTAGTGTVSLSIRDRPVDTVTELWVTITDVWLKPAGNGPPIQAEMAGSDETAGSKVTVNLLALNDENAKVFVDGVVIPAGRYNWIELQIDDSDLLDSYAMTEIGAMLPLKVDVPSGKIRLVSGFEVKDGEAVKLLIDWDVRAGLTEAVGSGTLKLRPAFRILDVDKYGVISGTVDDLTIAAETTCQGSPDPSAGKVVYVFEGDVPPDDIDGKIADPVTTVDAVFNVTTGDHDYRAAIMPGDYTVAFTCQGADDTDELSENLVFLKPRSGVALVTVSPGSRNNDIDF